MVIASRFLGNLLDSPGQCSPQGLTEHGATGFADGRQPTEGPVLRMALLELARLARAYPINLPSSQRLCFLYVPSYVDTLSSSPTLLEAGLPAWGIRPDRRPD